jgi:hypothetical protein
MGDVALICLAVSNDDMRGGVASITRNRFCRGACTSAAFAVRNAIEEPNRPMLPMPTGRKRLVRGGPEYRILNRVVT